MPSPQDKYNEIKIYVAHKNVENIKSTIINALKEFNCSIKLDNPDFKNAQGKKYSVEIKINPI